MNTQTRLGQVFVELADTMVEEFDVIEFMQMLTERTIELLDVDAAGLMLTDERGSLQLVASTVEKMRVLELFELQLQEGPCYDCWTTGRPVTGVALAEAVDRWPAFMPAALAAGYSSTHALPMRLRGRVIGALNLFADAEGPLDSEDIALGQAMADVATIGLLNQRTRLEGTLLSEQLQSALHSRVLIEQAKGALAQRAGIDLEEAFTRMRRHARGRGATLTTVAQAVLDGTIDHRVLVPTTRDR